MRLVTSERICFRDPLKRAVCCDISIYEERGLHVVVVEQIADYSGPSVTNAIEYIANYVTAEWRLDPLLTTWLEHWPPETGGAVEWSLVIFRGTRRDHDGNVLFYSPQWQYISPEKVAKMLGH